MDVQYRLGGRGVARPYQIDMGSPDFNVGLVTVLSINVGYQS